MTHPLTPLEQEEVQADLIVLFGELGRLAATPGINEVAEKRRQKALQLCRQEIERVQGLLALGVVDG